MPNRHKAIATLTLVLILIAGCGKAQSTATPIPPTDTPVPPTATATPMPPTADPVDTAWDDRAIFRPGLIGAEQEALDRLPGASVYHIDLQIPDDFLLLEGHEEVRYTNQEDEPLDEVYFRLFPNITGGAATVSALQVDGQDVEPVYEFQDSALRVSLPTALQPGERVVIQMDFEVEVAQEMGGNYGLFGYFDGVLVLDEFYPVIPVYDDEGTGPELAEGWNVEVPSRNGDVTYYDASFYLVRVTAPANLTVVASGIQVAREHEVDNQVLTFAAGPARDFYLAASEDYTVISETVGETTVNSYALPELTEGAKAALQFAADALRSFNQRFGVYPYTEFDVVSTPMQALGMEYPGLVAIALGLYDPNEQAAGLPFPIVLESTVAHEVAHQWFYNAVGNDQVDEPWLDEAVVQYLTGLYYVDTHGEGAARDYRSSWDNRWDRVGRADIPIGLPVAAYAGREYGAIVYGRGPLFVAALAEEMGQQTLDEFLRDYYQSHKWGIGTSEVFRQLAEQHCQCDLTALFEEWVYEKTATPVPSTSTPAPPTPTPKPTATPAPPMATPTPAGRASDGVVQRETRDLRITIVYDNTVYDSRLKAEWGFAALIEYGDHTLLFDTGGDSPTLLGNMDKLGLDPQPIEAVVLSHIHGDHVGGLEGLLGTGISPTVYVPAVFPASFKDSVRARTDLVEVTDPLEIFPGVHSTGQLSGRVIEQGLIVETSEGLVVITGCAHPGVVQMVRRAKEVVEDEVALVIGGFHLGESSQSQIRRIIAYFRELGVQQVSPVHCTGERAIAMFADEYGDDYVEGGVGRVIEKD